MLYQETREALWRMADLALPTTLFATRSKRCVLFSSIEVDRLTPVTVVDIRPAGLVGRNPNPSQSPVSLSRAPVPQ